MRSTFVRLALLAVLLTMVAACSERVVIEDRGRDPEILYKSGVTQIGKFVDGSVTCYYYRHSNGVGLSCLE